MILCLVAKYSGIDAVETAANNKEKIVPTINIHRKFVIKLVIWYFVHGSGGGGVIFMLRQ